MLKSRITKFSTIIAALCLITGSVSAQQVMVGVSGDGVIGKDSVKVGAPFMFDISLENKGSYKGFTLGFKLYGKDGLKKIGHQWTLSPDDSAFQASSDILAFNGFEDRSIWDMTGLQTPVFSWDGALPDTALIGGVAMNKGFEPCKLTHFVSFALEGVEAGTLCIDSAFVEPGGDWLYASTEGSARPSWNGPYCVTIVKGK